MSTWVYYALRLFPEREFVHRELPLRDVTIEPALSGPQTMSATLDPDVAALKDENGEPILQDFNTLILAEADGIIRGGGILASSTFKDAEFSLDIVGFSNVVKGSSMTTTLAYGGDNEAGRDPDGPVPHVGADPVQIVRDLWAQHQAKPRADLAVMHGGVTSTSHKIANWRNVPNVWTYHPDASTVIEITAPSNAQTKDNADSGDATKDYPDTTVFANVATNGTGFTKARKAGTSKIKPSKPIYWNHHIYYYETTDIGAKIDDYAASTPLEYREVIEWADADKDDVNLIVEWAYPRFGRKQDNLVFIEGENVVEVIEANSGGDDYANAVVAYGAGEGADQLRAEVSKDDGRMRVEKVITDTSITDPVQLKNWATTQLNTLSGIRDVEQVVVKQHSNAPMGSFEAGDDIKVQITTGWAAGTALWLRITGYSYAPETDLITISTKLSSSFSYVTINTT